MRLTTTRRLAVGVAMCAAVALVPLEALPTGPTPTPEAEATGLLPPPITATWLETINFYRASSGVPALVEDQGWSDGARKHVDYLVNTPASLRTGVYASTHTENPASPWYTPEGLAAAGSSNIGIGTIARDAIDTWMRAPFHAIGILRPRLQRSGFAMASNITTLDVLRGLGSAPVAAGTVLFPGPDSFTYLDRFASETPDPREGCATDWDQFQGLPLFAMLPAAPPIGTTAELTLPDGRTLAQGNDLCVQTAATYNSSDPMYGASGKQVLAADNAVLVIPRFRLGGGGHTVTIRQPGLADVRWSFTVLGSPMVPSNVRALWAGAGKVHLSWSAPPTAALTDLVSFVVAGGGQMAPRSVGPEARAVVLDVPVAPSGSASVAATTAFATGPSAHDSWSRPSLPGMSGVGGLLAVPSRPPAGSEAVLANLAMTDSPALGYVTADRCSRMQDGPPGQASGNHGVGEAIANLAVVAIDPDGSFCLYSQVPTHLVVDVQGSFAPKGELAFDPVSPRRVLDTRSNGAMPATGAIVRVATGSPAGTKAALVNLAMTDSPVAGYITADRCSVLTAGPQTKASGNHGVGTAIANLAVVPLDADGSFCIYTQVPTHLIVDLQGTFSTDGTLRFTPSSPAVGATNRVLDSRNVGPIPSAGSIVRIQTGAPAGTKAALVNLAMTDATLPGYITADRCSVLTAGPQTKASGNHGVGTAIANLAVVPLDADGSFCIYTQVPTHLVVDLQGTFSATGSLRFTPTDPATASRVLDTRN